MTFLRAYLIFSVCLWLAGAGILVYAITTDGGNPNGYRWPYNAPSVLRYDNDEFVPYKERFIKLAEAFGQQRNRKVFVHFAADETFPVLTRGADKEKYQPIGMCLPYQDAGVVIIRISSWIKYDAWLREALVFHELGHCYLDILRHRDTLWDSSRTKQDGFLMPDWEEKNLGAHVSVMNSVIMTSDRYRQERNWYLEEMFDLGSRD